MNDREGLADRGNVIILLYNARKFSGTNEPTTLPSSSAPITLINQNTSLRGDDLLLSQSIQSIVEEEIKSLISFQLLTSNDLAMLDKKITLHYTQGCESL
jgi:hypothetical protein